MIPEVDQLAEDPAVLRARIATDPARPRFHFTAPTGWLNDPNGLCQWDGIHHLFYQYNPFGGYHHRIHWGHATSTDLVHWADQPVALAPDRGGPDSDGCWSGVLVDDGGVPTVVYSGKVGDVVLPCLATGSADLLNWRKFAGNPVIDEQPLPELAGFRDHCVWREGDQWRMLIGAGVADSGGFVALYESPDLRSWRYLGPILSGTMYDRAYDDPLWPGTVWECAELFRLAGDQDVPLDRTHPGRDFLVFSAWHGDLSRHALYWSGSYRGDSFAPEGLHPLDLGGAYFYAPQSYRDDAGRRIMFGWLQEARGVTANLAAGWAGVMSMPRLVAERGDGTLHLSPAPEVDLLHGALLANLSTVVVPGTAQRFPEVAGDQLDLELCATLCPGAGIEIHLPGEEVDDGYLAGAILRIFRIRQNKLEVQLDRSATTWEPGVDTGPRGGAAPVSDEGITEVRVLIDHSVLEVFVNGVPLSARVHSTGFHSPLTLRATGDGVATSLRAWRMPDALPRQRL